MSSGNSSNATESPPKPTEPARLANGSASNPASTSNGWRDKVQELGVKWLLAQNAAGLESTLRGNRIAERLALKTQDGTVGMPGEPSGVDDIDDTAVSVGNEIHHHYQHPPQPPQQPAPQPPSPQANGLSRTAKTLIGAALAGAMGSGAAIPLAIDYFAGDDPPPAVQPADPSEYGIGFVEPPESG